MMRGVGKRIVPAGAGRFPAPGAAPASGLPMRIVRDLLLNPILSLSFAVVLLGGGIFGVVEDRADRKLTAHLARLVPAAEAAPGAAAYLEGRIAAEQPVRHAGLVAWQREEYRSCGRSSSCWRGAGGEAPPLLVRDRDGRTWTTTGGYALAVTADTVAEAEPGWTRGSVRSRGFAPGQALVAVGRVAADGRGVEADALYAGTYAGLLAERRRIEETLPWFVGAAAAGVLLLGVGIWQVRRFVRQVEAERVVPAPVRTASAETAVAAPAHPPRPSRLPRGQRGPKPR